MASSFLRFLDHTQRRIEVGRTPLDEWSALRRDLYLTTHNTHNRQTSISPVIFTIIYLFIYLFLFHYRSMTGCFLSKNLISLHIKCHFRNFHNMRCLFWLLATCHSPVHIILSISVVIFPEVNATQTKFSKLPYLIYLTHYLASIRRYKKTPSFVLFFYLSGSERRLFLLTWKESKCTQANTKLQSTMWLPLLLPLASTEICCHTESNMKCFLCHVIWCSGRLTSVIQFKESVF